MSHKLITQLYFLRQTGQGCAVGEHFLHFDFKSEEAHPMINIESSSIVTNCTAACGAPPSSEKSTCTRKLIVHELITVLQLKQQLLDDWDTAIFSGNTCPLPSKPKCPHHIRLRDVKIPGSSGLGTLLRNERVLARCISGMSDGRKISLMVITLPSFTMVMENVFA